MSDGFANGDENSSRHFEKQDDDGDNRGNGEYSSQEQSPKPRNYEDWTRAWDNLFALDILPSLKPTDTAYGVSCAHIQSILPESARERAAQNGGIYPFEDLRHAPVGASGLHVISTKNGATVVGLRPGHGDAHWMRASFESMIYDLRAKRSQIRELWGLRYRSSWNRHGMPPAHNGSPIYWRHPCAIFRAPSQKSPPLARRFRSCDTSNCPRHKRCLSRDRRAIAAISCLRSPFRHPLRTM